MATRAAEPLTTRLTWDEELHRTYTSRYQVLSDKTANPVEVANSAGIPTYATSYNWYGAVDLWAFCRSIEVERDDTLLTDPEGIWASGAYKWTCTVKHSSKPASGDNDNQTQRNNPLDDPPKITGSFAPFGRTVYQDKDNNPIQNTAGFPVNPPLETQDAYDTIRISWNTATIDLEARAQYRHKVNSEPIWGLQARQVKMMRWGYNLQYAGVNLPYIKNDLEFLVSYRQGPTTNVASGPTDAIGWFNTVPNEGDIYYEGGTKTVENRKRFTDGEDQPLSQPGRLATNGDQLPDGDPLHWLVFPVEEEIDFRNIPGLPPLPNPPFLA